MECCIVTFVLQLTTLKLELDSRPTQEDFDAKVQQGNSLRLELSILAEQMTSNEKILEQMQKQLNDERERHAKMMEKCLVEREVQTEAQESTKEVSVVEEAALEKSSTSTVLTESPPIVVEKVTEKSTTTMPQITSATTSTSTRDDVDNDDDDALNNHPKVLYEDELIVFKEKCTNLTSENVRLHREISEIRANLSQYHNSWFHNFLLKYLVPMLIVFVAYIFYLLK